MSIAKPLHDMVKKDRKWEWMEKQEEAFKELKIYTRTSTGSTRPGQKNEDGGRCVRLCNWESTVNEGKRWKVKTSYISFQVIK